MIKTPFASVKEYQLLTSGFAKKFIFDPPLDLSYAPCALLP